jgi:hypothetical protein
MLIHNKGGTCESLLIKRMGITKKGYLFLDCKAVQILTDEQCCAQCCGSGSGRIRTFLAGSGRLGPDPYPRLHK